MKDIKFVKYVPYDDFNYCYGDLHLLVDGKEWKGTNVLGHTFGFHFTEDGDEVYTKGHWTLEEKAFSDFSKEEKKLIFKLVNSNMVAHCCGGCA